MAKCNLLLLLPMVLLACSTIFPARISGRSMVDGAPGGAGEILRSYNGCSYNKQNPKEIDALFCCDKDHECWPSLQVCMANCPCKVNC